MPLGLEKAIELVGRLDRTIGYPKEGPGVMSLARGLQKAADAVQVPGAKIVERCAETSQYCPTDADLFTVARDIARCDALAAGSYDSMASAGNHVSAARVTECALCGGTGWEIRWYLHTQQGGRFNFVKKERISEAQAKELEGKIDRRTQWIYSGAMRCTCPIPVDQQSFAAGDRQ